MANIKLHGNGLTAATCVPNIFIDDYMTNANGEFVKIYLYLLRCMNAPDCTFSISETADRFEHTEKDIKRALTYWEKMQLLHLEYDAKGRLTGISFASGTAQDEKTECVKIEETDVISLQEDPSREEPETIREIPAASSMSREELKRFQEQETTKELLFITESYLGRTLNPTEIETIYFWFTGLGFSADLVEYLMEYCIGKGHKSLHYINKVALNWKESGISDVAAAKLLNASFDEAYYSVIKAFGITGRNLIDSEAVLVKKWTKEFAFSMDLIKEACRRTISATQKPSFSYADSILLNWHKKNVHCLADVAKLDAAHQKTSAAKRSVSKAPVSKNQFNNFPQRSYNYDKLEEQLLKSSVHSCN